MLNHYRTLFVATVLGWLTIQGTAPAQDCPSARPACEPGYRIVEEICYREVCRKVCKVVPSTKKTVKPVYSCKEEDYCLPKCRLCDACKNKGCCNEECKQCSCPRIRKILVKKFVTEECPTTKCVVETVVETVPCKVYRKVPCSATPAGVLPRTPAGQVGQ